MGTIISNVSVIMVPKKIADIVTADVIESGKRPSCGPGGGILGSVVMPGVPPSCDYARGSSAATMATKVINSIESRPRLKDIIHRETVTIYQIIFRFLSYMNRLHPAGEGEPPGLKLVS